MTDKVDSACFGVHADDASRRQPEALDAPLDERTRDQQQRSVVSQGIHAGRHTRSIERRIDSLSRDRDEALDRYCSSGKNIFSVFDLASHEIQVYVTRAVKDEAEIESMRERRRYGSWVTDELIVGVLFRADDGGPSGSKGSEREKERHGRTRRRRTRKVMTAAAAPGTLDRRGEVRTGVGSLLPLPVGETLRKLFSAIDHETTVARHPVKEAVAAIKCFHGEGPTDADAKHLSTSIGANRAPFRGAAARAGSGSSLAFNGVRAGRSNISSRHVERERRIQYCIPSEPDSIRVLTRVCPSR